MAGYSRSPHAEYISKEIGWYSNEDETLIGVLLLDIQDLDYAAVVLTRDEGNRFRAFENECSFAQIEKAKQWLISTMKWHTGQGLSRFNQGDGKQGIDLFKPLVPTEKQHIYYYHLMNGDLFTPARELIRNMMPYFADIDGNYVEQFQTTGFDSRLWELFLFAYLSEEKLFINREHNAPDFMVSNYDETIAMEAVIVGRRNNNPPTYFTTFPNFKPANQVDEEFEDLMPIRFGSPLYSKLKKKYWELPHVQGNPLILAIADFHDDGSMLWSSTALYKYLYGVKHDFHYDDEGKLIITPQNIASHKAGRKEIPSGFFFQEDSDNISAVLFSASGTISKFNRIGRQAGFKADNSLMIRIGTYHDHDPDASVPKMFKYIVNEKCNERWADGISMFHNPNAKFPVDDAMFPSIAHHHFTNGQIISNLPEFYPYASWTLNLKVKKE